MSPKHWVIFLLGHSRAGGNPSVQSWSAPDQTWMPAFAGMTIFLSAF
jgi:hypothetical protein